MKKINKFIRDNIKLLILIFLFLQPIIDLFTSISLNVFRLNITFGIIVRLIFLFLMIYYFIFVRKKIDKKKTYLYLSGILLYVVLFSLNVLINKDLSSVFYELQGIIKIFYITILLLIFKEEKIDISNRNLVMIMFTYVLLIIIPVVTNTSFNGYTQGKIGNIGWFNSTNEISSILSMLFPIFMAFLVKDKMKIIYKVIMSLLLIYVMFSLGSKITILSMFITIFIFIILYFRHIIKKKDSRLLVIIVSSIIVISSVGIFLVPKTNFYKNIVIHLDYLGINCFSDLVTYENIDDFIFSERLSFLEETRNNYNRADISSKVLGIGYIENFGTDNINMKTIEMDYFDIMYRTGIIGSILFFVVFISLCINRFKDFFSKIKKNIKDIDYVSYIVSLFIILIMSLLSGHVLVSPGVSIFVVIILLNRNKIKE
ncbi:MAG: O-antigen ligase family protein [Bacilli bacterium]|nr:O-antigen ligase family protein [Bacilli bacterium]